MMLLRIRKLCAIGHDDAGSMAIETAFVSPILLILALGGFEASSMIARQTELQSAAAEAAAVVRAVAPEDATGRNTVRGIVATSICGNDTPEVVGEKAICGEDDQISVQVTPLKRCGTADDYIADSLSCGSDAAYRFIRVDLSDTYEPIWTEWGVSDGFTYNVSRTVQVG